MVIYPAIIEGSIEGMAKGMENKVPARLLSLLLLAGDREAKRYLCARGTGTFEPLEKKVKEIEEQFGRPLAVVMAEARLRRAEDLKEQVVETRPSRRIPFAERIDAGLRTPATGLLALALILCLLYLWVGRFGAGTLGWLLQDQLFDRWIIPSSTHLIRPLGWPFLEEMLVGPFGLISMGLSSSLGLILPVLATFFLALAFLEDSGYIARLGVLSHRLFRRVGLHGKAVLTIFLGFSCVTMAALASRFLDSKKERLIATFLLGLGIPCSAQLSVIFALASSIPLSAFLFVFSVIFGIELGMGVLANRAVPGMGSDFLMEVFPLRVPRLKDLLLKTHFRIIWFIREAIPLFLLGTFILFLCNEIGILYSIEKVAEPVVTGLLGLPAEATDAFMMGFFRKEGAVPILKGLADKGRLSHLQTVISLILTTLFIPCTSTVLVMLKDHGPKATFYVIAVILILCLAVGGALNFLLPLLGVTF